MPSSRPSLPAALLLVVGGVMTSCGSAAPPGNAADDDPPPGVVQLLPRGAISAIVDPHFVGASDADIPAEAWVLGVDIGDEPRAYSLNLLNHHEVVNDRAAGKTFAAVW